MKGQITSIILFFVIIAPSLTTLVWMHTQRELVKHDAELKLMSGVNKNELVLLKFTKDEAEKKLKWEHSKEFEYNFVIYDVVKIQSTSDSIFYWCWPDIKETHLENTFTGLINGVLGNPPFQTEKQAQIISYFKTLYCMLHAHWHVAPLDPGNIHNTATHFYFFSSFLFPPLTPPPELV